MPSNTQRRSSMSYLTLKDAQEALQVPNDRRQEALQVPMLYVAPDPQGRRDTESQCPTIGARKHCKYPCFMSYLTLKGASGPKRSSTVLQSPAALEKFTR